MELETTIRKLFPEISLEEKITVGRRGLRLHRAKSDPKESQPSALNKLQVNCTWLKNYKTQARAKPPTQVS